MGPPHPPHQAAGQEGSPGAGGGRGRTRARAHRPARLRFRGEPLVCSPLPPPPPPRNLSVQNRKEMRNVAVAGGGGRAGEAAGGRVVPGGRAETWPLPAPALAAGGPGLRGPTRQGQRHPGRWHGASGDHGVRLHSGQSFRGTPARPGNRTDTRPAGGREPRLRSAPLHLLSLPGLPAALGSKAGGRPAPAAGASRTSAQWQRLGAVPARPPPLQQCPRGWESHCSTVSGATGQSQGSPF